MGILSDIYNGFLLQRWIPTESEVGSFLMILIFIVMPIQILTWAIEYNKPKGKQKSRKAKRRASKSTPAFVGQRRVLARSTSTRRAGCTAMRRSRVTSC